MYGKGILKGLGVTIKRYIDTYVDDIRWLGKRYYKSEGIEHRSSKDSRGIFTIQYPEEKIPSPEEFRYIPFLVYDENENGEANHAVYKLWNLFKSLPTSMHMDHENNRSRNRSTYS